MTRLTTFTLALLLAHDAYAQTAQELKRLTLEELTQMEISTVMRGPEPVSRVPAAVFVITQEDIRRSGMLTLPEILRLAPGVQVARIDAGRWAIGMRGFGDRLARSMLVLIDGRAVYSPLFAGTYWEVQDVLLEDIERIEVIRGPGGTLWGANAVNGIISIITKDAAQTHGLFARASAGSGEHGLGSLRYGLPIGRRGHLRAYVRGRTAGEQFHVDAMDYDALQTIQGGFRADWSLRSAHRLTLQGDAYTMRLGERAITTSYSPPFSTTSAIEAPLNGGNVLARVSGRLAGGTEYQVQTFYDRTRRDELPVAETRDTFDVDYQQRQPRWSVHAITWGLGHRASSGRITAAFPTEFVPANRTDNLVSAFVQDDVALSDTVNLAIGTKVEHNSYSGWEFQPSWRIAWTIDPVNTLVGSVTRAVRTPSRVETDYTTTSLVNPAPTFVRLLPNPSFEPEELVAYELGHRLRAGHTYITTSAFFNQLTDVLSTELDTAFVETTPGPARLILPVSFLNGLHGNSHGLEATADVRPASWWRSGANYSLVRIQLTRDPGGRDVSQERRNEGLSPRHQVRVHSSFDLPRGVALDWQFRYVSRLPAGPVPAYATSSVRVAWQPASSVEIAVVGQDLHRAHHLEWFDGGIPIEITRRAYVTATLRR
jgi:iron complex outermembrane receptor protein